MPKRASPIETYYWVKADGCWQWIGGKNQNRCYGRYKFQGKMFPAHRFMYIKYKGEIPDDLVIDHVCRNTLCVNPDHLEAVSYAENVRRGKGTKLNETKVKEIKQMLTNKITEEKIAQIYGVTRQTINSISWNRNWRDSNAL
jgi:DNA-binding XRE family transcriptional regulator